MEQLIAKKIYLEVNFKDPEFVASEQKNNLHTTIWLKPIENQYIFSKNELVELIKDAFGRGHDYAVYKDYPELFRRPQLDKNEYLTSLNIK